MGVSQRRWIDRRAARVQPWWHRGGRCSQRWPWCTTRYRLLVRAVPVVRVVICVPRCGERVAGPLRMAASDAQQRRSTIRRYLVAVPWPGVARVSLSSVSSPSFSHHWVPLPSRGVGRRMDQTWTTAQSITRGNVPVSYLYTHQVSSCSCLSCSSRLMLSCKGK